MLGGTGNVGSAIASALSSHGWDITVGARHQQPSEHELVVLDRAEDGALAVADGFDLLVDVIPFEAAHAEQLLARDVGAIVAISSASVYADDSGRTLDEAETAELFPELPVPIPETQPTVAPGDATYSTKKVALERALLENEHVPAAVIRPCAIYGRGDRMAREWHFVKRALDHRPYVLLPNRGVGHFHTTASENIGELVRLVAASPRTGVYNCGDPDPPHVLDIARTIAGVAGHERTEVLLPDVSEVGATPWSVPKPFLVDMSKAEQELGYRAATSWTAAIPTQVEWLIEATRDRDWREVIPRGAQYLSFDYEAEDELVRSLAA
ncbi:MAG: NAD-dependent epimerase/dehydratase family protein [Gaiellaceae bacterium]